MHKRMTCHGDCRIDLSGKQELLQKAFLCYEAPLSATEMADYIYNFALTGNKFYNGRVLQVSTSTP